MEPYHIHDALNQVRDIRQIVLEGQRFKGYSRWARALSGSLALLAAFVMASAWFPKTATAHLYGWGVVFGAGLFLNYGALGYKFLFASQTRQQVRTLRPTLNAFPSLFVGGVLTFTLIRIGAFDLLFGMWMCLYGVMSLAARQGLPRLYWIVGMFYIGCGTGYLLSPEPSFLNPYPMGLVFFAGECLGGFLIGYSGKIEVLNNKN